MSAEREKTMEEQLRAMRDLLPPGTSRANVEAKLAISAPGVLGPVAPSAGMSSSSPPSSAMPPFARSAALIIGGVIAGAVGYRLLSPRAEPVREPSTVASPTQNRIAVLPLPDASVAVVVDAARSVDPVDRREERRRGPTDETVTPESQRLERTLIDTARVALRSGRSDDAMIALFSHERRFPAGDLVQEREVLIVRALQLHGRDDQARARARDYLRRFPGGLASDELRAIAERTDN